MKPGAHPNLLDRACVDDRGPSYRLPGPHRPTKGYYCAPAAHLGRCCGPVARHTVHGPLLSSGPVGRSMTERPQEIGSLHVGLHRESHSVTTSVIISTTKETRRRSLFHKSGVDNRRLARKSISPSPSPPPRVCLLTSPFPRPGRAPAGRQLTSRTCCSRCRSAPTRAPMLLPRPQNKYNFRTEHANQY